MLTLLLPVLGMAALDSLNPSAIAVTLLLVVRAADRGGHSGKLVLPYVLGVYLTMIVGGAVLLLGVDTLVSALEDNGSSQVTYTIRLGVGVVLLLVGVLTPTRSRRVSRGAGALTSSPSRLLALGAAITVVELPTAVPYLAAVTLMSSSDLSWVQWLLLLLLYNLVVVLPPLAILVASRFAGQRFDAWARRTSQQVKGSGRGLALTLAFVVGLYLTADAAYYFDFFGLVDVPQRHPAR